MVRLISMPFRQFFKNRWTKKDFLFLLALFPFIANAQTGAFYFEWESVFYKTVYFTDVVFSITVNSHYSKNHNH